MESECNIHCLGKATATYDYRVAGKRYLFRGQTSKTVPVSVGKILKNMTDSFGKSVFLVDFPVEQKEAAVEHDWFAPAGPRIADESVIIEDIVEDKPVEMEVIKTKTYPKPKKSSKKKQSKLV
jgi:hypothetical protein